MPGLGGRPARASASTASAASRSASSSSALGASRPPRPPPRGPRGPSRARASRSGAIRRSLIAQLLRDELGEIAHEGDHARVVHAAGADHAPGPRASAGLAVGRRDERAVAERRLVELVAEADRHAAPRRAPGRRRRSAARGPRSPRTARAGARGPGTRAGRAPRDGSRSRGRPRRASPASASRARRSARSRSRSACGAERPRLASEPLAGLAQRAAREASRGAPPPCGRAPPGRRGPAPRARGGSAAPSRVTSTASTRSLESAHEAHVAELDVVEPRRAARSRAGGCARRAAATPRCSTCSGSSSRTCAASSRISSCPSAARSEQPAHEDAQAVLGREAARRGVGLRQRGRARASSARVLRTRGRRAGAPAAAARRCRTRPARPGRPRRRRRRAAPRLARRERARLVGGRFDAAGSRCDLRSLRPASRHPRSASKTVNQAPECTGRPAGQTAPGQLTRSARRPCPRAAGRRASSARSPAALSARSPPAQSASIAGAEERRGGAPNSRGERRRRRGRAACGAPGRPPRPARPRAPEHLRLGLGAARRLDGREVAARLRGFARRTPKGAPGPGGSVDQAPTPRPSTGRRCQ